jgi:hypothetical protein
MTSDNEGFRLSLIQRCRKAIKQAVQQFGEHEFCAGGAHSVMDLQPFLDEFRKMPREDAAMTLAILEQDQLGALFASDIRGTLNIW